MSVILDAVASQKPIRARLGEARTSFTAWRARRSAFQTTYRELAALSERELEDLGISRARIGEVACEAARQSSSK